MGDQPSKVETIKAQSRWLRGHLAEELRDASTPTVSEEGYQLLKFHGVYAQDDRDVRRARRAAGQMPDYRFMVRAAIAGGVLGPDQYLALEAVAEELGVPSLRITSRQGIQFHGVHKFQLRHLIGALNRHLITTWAGCGDVERNLTACPAPWEDGAHRKLGARAKALAQHLKPRSRAYVELWMDGEAVYSWEADAEPLYGPTYLPRKFKTGLTLAGHNCIDVLTHDLGLVGHPTPDGEDIAAWTVLVGGGLGKSHGVAATHPALAQVLGEVADADVVAAVEAVITVQRDFGNRSDRKFARLKYLVEAWGIDRFRRTVEERMGFSFRPARPLDFEPLDDHLGWHETGPGRGFLGLWVECGRIVDTPERRLRTALKEVVRRWRLGVHLTPHQNLLLTGIASPERRAIEECLAAHGVKPVEGLSPVQRYGMACPALPTCGLALTEAERVFSGVAAALSARWEALGLGAVPIAVRMTGCPNNCARPFTAEVGLVGRSPGRYAIYLGGNAKGTRLAQLWRDAVPLEAVVPALEPLFTAYAARRRPNERFGDWWAREGALAGVATEGEPWATTP
ncbi:MAG: NADPH-dependent assimilatory sulfite reductase hemoprotein subunit [Firmicutes bacterium]|nr:NADPH-dependent assimilatory sulfite reductase hemoprotein subunit [Alicyclobacillaceae bacterium]MCL6497077.1 NADPH-dependent assimilatory sulfite reductase hemoprotein subunit [Bacillota bacterium]